MDPVLPPTTTLLPVTSNPLWQYGAFGGVGRIFSFILLAPVYCSLRSLRAYVPASGGQVLKVEIRMVENRQLSSTGAESNRKT